MFFIVAVVLLFVLPGPWNVIGAVAALGAFAVEIVFWNRRVRRRRAAVGGETLIGRSGTVLTACRPHGQVRLGGEIWEARCSEGADRDDTVRVAGQEGLTLIVERHEAGS
jgi:membrane-bound serine protease (ClpP class)